MELDGDVTELFAVSGESQMTAEGERAYITVMQGLSKIQKEMGISVGLEAAQGAMRAAVDWTQLVVGPVAAHELPANLANEKWRAMLAAKKRRAA